MVTQVNHLQDTLESIFSEYESARFDDALNETMQTSKDTDHSQDISRAVLADSLEKDENYQSLLKKLDKLLVKPGFMQGKKGRYSMITSELSSIKRQHERDLFGESLPEESMPELTLKHPMNILYEVIMSVRENEQIQIECEESKANLSKEQDKERTAGIEVLKEFYEKRGVCFDLQNIDKEEDKLIIHSLSEHKVKGIIKFPCYLLGIYSSYTNIESACLYNLHCSRDTKNIWNNTTVPMPFQHFPKGAIMSSLWEMHKAAEQKAEQQKRRKRMAARKNAQREKAINDGRCFAVGRIICAHFPELRKYQPQYGDAESDGFMMSLSRLWICCRATGSYWTGSKRKPFTADPGSPIPKSPFDSWVCSLIHSHPGCPCGTLSGDRVNWKEEPQWQPIISALA